MKTDKELYKLFSRMPALLFEIADIKAPDTYKMVSITLKEFERRADGFLQPLSIKSPVYFVEFHGYWDDTIYHRMVMEMAAFGAENPKREVRGILFFTHKYFDTKTLPWHTMTESDRNVFKVVYLNDFLDELENADPDHPLVSTFKPYRIEDTDQLQNESKQWYQNIKQSSYSEPEKEAMESVFIRWMQERFANKSYEEVTKMFVELTPLEETRSYKELVSLGEKKGRKEGIKEGRKEGKKEATKRIVAKMIANRFNINTQRISPRLRSLSIADLDDLCDHLFKMKSQDEAFKWINDRKRLLQSRK